MQSIFQHRRLRDAAKRAVDSIRTNADSAATSHHTTNEINSPNKIKDTKSRSKNCLASKSRNLQSMIAASLTRSDGQRVTRRTQ